METDIYGIVDKFERDKIEEYADGYLKINGYEFFICGNRYAVKNVNEQEEIFSSDNIEDIGRILNSIIRNYSSWPIVLIESISYVKVREIKRAIDSGKFILEEFIVRPNGICPGGYTKDYEITQEDLPKLLGEAQNNGFLSSEQRKYLENYIKL